MNSASVASSTHIDQAATRARDSALKRERHAVRYFNLVLRSAKDFRLADNYVTGLRIDRCVSRCCIDTPRPLIREVSIGVVRPRGDPKRIVGDRDACPARGGVI